MLTAAELQVIIGADTKGAEKGLDSVQKKLLGFSKSLVSTGKALSVGLTAPLSLAASGMIQVGIKAEQTRVAFTTLLGSAEEAGRYLEELADFASKTPFGLSELEDASRMMMAYGFSAEQVIPILRDIGDAVSGLGLGAEGVDRVIRALGQMQQKGKVTAQEMMQLSEAGIAGWRYLAESMGLSVSEVMQLSEKGAISAQKAIDAILAGMRKDFGGMMAEQSKTAGGAISNLKDELEKLSRSLSEEFIPYITKGAQKLTEFVESFRNAPEDTKKLALGLVAIAAAAGPTLIVLGKLIEIATKLRGVFLALAGLSLEKLVSAGAVGVIIAALTAVSVHVYRFSRTFLGGIAEVQNAWTDFTRGLGKSADSANEALDAYNERQKEVADKGGLVGRALLWVSEKLQGTGVTANELAQALLNSSVSYEDYRSAMERAGLSAQAYNEQQWQILKNMEMESARTRFLKDDYIDLAGGIDMATESTQSLTEYADELVGQYEEVNRQIQDINQSMEDWLQHTASLVASGLESWFRDISSESSSLQSEIERLNEELAKQREKLKVTRDEDERARLQERIAELQKELAEKTKALSAAQTDLQQSTVRYEAALAVVDEIMGTNYFTTYQLEKSVQALVDEYTRTGDLDAFKAGLQKIKNDGLQPLQSALQGAISKAQELYNKLMQLPKEIRISIKVDTPPTITVPTPQYTPAPTPITPPPPAGGLIPKQSGGSVFSGRAYLVGESGPELFIPNKSGMIIPNSDLSPVNVTVNASVSEHIDIEMLAREVVRAIQRNRSLARAAL